jgi:hypothetical protein
MKEMIYTKERKFTLLDEGQLNGIKWKIVSLGTHPTAYVGIPKSHVYFGKDYDEVNINCHGGLTYSKSWILNLLDEIDVWWFGWDYAHYDDYTEFGRRYNQNPLKKWTTEEIKKEVMDVIKQMEITEITAKSL